VWPNYLIFNNPFAALADAIEAGQDSGIYDATDLTLNRHMPMTQKVDVVSSGKSTIHTMVVTVSDLLSKRIAGL